jgi:Flp pilus assembly protein TadD
VQYYKEALQYYPKDPGILTGLAAIARRENNLALARALLLQAIEADPELLEPRVELAAVHLQIGHPDKVADVFAPLDVLQQRSPEVLALSARATTSNIRQHRTATAFEAALAEQAEHVPSLFALASMAEKNADLPLLEKYLGPLTRVASEEPLVLQLRARAASMTGQPAEAALFSERAYVQAPSRENFLQLVDHSAQAGRQTASRQMLRRWLEINPHDATVRVALAVNLEASGNLQDASVEYMRALETEPENLVALNNLAWMVRRENPDLALEYINRSTADIRHSPALLDTRAVIEHLNGQNVRALSAIEQAQELAPDNATIRYHKAMIVAALGEKEKALASLQELLTGDSGEFPERQEAEALLKSLKEAG